MRIRLMHMNDFKLDDCANTMLTRKRSEYNCKTLTSSKLYDYSMQFKPMVHNASLQM